jgi:hypothetical protein
MSMTRVKLSLLETERTLAQNCVEEGTGEADDLGASLSWGIGDRVVDWMRDPNRIRRCEERILIEGGEGFDGSS